ncbi:MAG: Lrp/AsnC family transcriptional regulator, partial [Crenarchaeota archaeon]|nr:Lrp/AsnC family transcriptional regulator [Thermoproteota archaeon]
MANLTTVDTKILTILLQDGRKNFVELANACNVTKNNVWKRFRVLEKKQIIVGATTQVNFTAFGYDSVATLLIK